MSSLCLSTQLREDSFQPKRKSIRTSNLCCFSALAFHLFAFTNTLFKHYFLCPCYFCNVLLLLLLILNSFALSNAPKKGSCRHLTRPSPNEASFHPKHKSVRVLTPGRLRVFIFWLLAFPGRVQSGCLSFTSFPLFSTHKETEFYISSNEGFRFQK